MIASTLSQNSGKTTVPYSIRAYQRHGILPSILLRMLRDFPNFPDQFQDLLSEYYLLYWAPEYFREVSKGGVIQRGNREYIVVFAKGATPAALLSCNQVKLSFRSALPDYHLPAYVIVSKGN